MDAVRPSTLPESVRVAVHHLRAAARLRPRYGSQRDVDAHVDRALSLLERALRDEDITREVPT